MQEEWPRIIPIKRIGIVMLTLFHLNDIQRKRPLIFIVDQRLFQNWITSGHSPSAHAVKKRKKKWSSSGYILKVCREGE